MIADHRKLVVDVDDVGLSFVTVGRLLDPEGDWRPGWNRFGCSPMTLGDAVFTSVEKVTSAYWSALASHANWEGLN